MISKDSMSFGFRLAMLPVMTPSTTNIGDLPDSAVPRPLMIIVGVAPGASFAMMFTPAALPCIDCKALYAGCFEIWSDLIVEIALVRSVFFCVP
ncbi:hypothetical protein D9M72_536230 [compost metagenome]